MSMTSLAQSSAPFSELEREEEYQDHALQGVSRTFAATIPHLPDELRRVVTTAYLLCRIADTIEDEPQLTAAQKRQFHDEFVGALSDYAAVESFADRLEQSLSNDTLEAERALVKNTPRIIRIVRSYSVSTQRILFRCLSTMCDGMTQFEDQPKLLGLASLRELHAYCYFVAGVVGETLTELFCAHSPEIMDRRAQLMSVAVSFGQGLQLTNILKDVATDFEHGRCWLPRDVFGRRGFDLQNLAYATRSEAFGSGIAELVAIAHGHLRNGLTYVSLIPSKESGIRTFALKAIHLAVLTLRKIYGHRNDVQRRVKISRRTARLAMFITNRICKSNLANRSLFTLLSLGLPKATRMLSTCESELDTIAYGIETLREGQISS